MENIRRLRRIFEQRAIRKALVDPTGVRLHTPAEEVRIYDPSNPEEVAEAEKHALEYLEALGEALKEYEQQP